MRQIVHSLVIWQRARTGLMVIGVLALTNSVRADCDGPNAIEALTTNKIDLFGWSAVVSNTSILISAAGYDNPAFLAGAVFVFDKDNRAQTANITVDRGDVEDGLGLSIGCSGNVLIAGAPGVDGPPPGQEYGVAYIFNFANGKWELIQILQSDAGAHGDLFGNFVGMDGNIAVVGSHGDDDACPLNPNCNSGSVYVFRFDGKQWNQETKLRAADAEFQDLFGFGLDIDGEAVVVGAHEDDDNGRASGSAYVFRYDGKQWIQEAKLTAPDSAFDLLGYSVAIDGDWIVAGAPQIELASSGLARIYHRDGDGQWSLAQTLLPSDGNAEDHFGRNVAIHDGTIIIGSRNDDDMALNAGAAYVYRLDASTGTWGFFTKLYADADDIAPDDHFGHGVAVHGTMAVIGAPHSNVNGIDSGAAYVFHLPTCAPLPGDITFNGVVDVDDLLGVINDWGSCEAGDGCWSDLDGDGDIGVPDLMSVISNWG